MCAYVCPLAKTSSGSNVTEQGSILFVANFDSNHHEEEREREREEEGLNGCNKPPTERELGKISVCFDQRLQIYLDDAIQNDILFDRVKGK